ncbi:MAG: hypothetical protein M0Q26_00150 [Chitinophagaceae bacterium]|nr:hypothetical protein [Chitinophagaceae bacterium]MDP1762393.1 hypothetical protein [Sediminibacterium sp.]MDP1810633.1 hypothetical protein [Sediminibacterium sp.]MDP3128585.1 hypothetical protein [Sediminibacterium sp.]MDP3666592.1 hypothetical protein [Sediminibacterium sp.]
MVDLDLQIKNIQDKLQQLLRQQAVLQRDNQRLKKELEKTEGIDAGKDRQIQSLQQQVDTLKIGSLHLNEEDKSALGKRIDIYLKEIDKCLAMLNT